MSLIDDILEKKKIKSVDDLSAQEKMTYNSIKKELETEVTVDVIKRFCKAEIKILEKEWLNMDCKHLTDLTVRSKELIIKARIQNYIKLLSIFNKVDKVKKHGEKRAKELLND